MATAKNSIFKKNQIRSAQAPLGLPLLNEASGKLALNRAETSDSSNARADERRREDAEDRFLTGALFSLALLGFALIFCQILSQ